MISLKSTRVGVLIYNECMELNQLIFSPSIPGVLEKIKLDNYNEDGVKGIITSAINLSAKFEIEEPLPLVVPAYIGKKALYLKAFYIGDTLWQEYIDIANRMENDKQLEKEEKKRVLALTKAEREYAKEKSDLVKKKRSVIAENKRNNKEKWLKAVKNSYNATFIYKDTGEIYKVYEGNNQKMISYRTGIPKNKIRNYCTVNFKNIFDSKVKHIQKAIDDRGLLLRIEVKRGAHD
jgi:hypothetical protein